MAAVLQKCKIQSHRNIIKSIRLIHNYESEILADSSFEKAKEVCKEFIAPVENETLMKNIMKSLSGQLSFTTYAEKKVFTSLATKNTFQQDFATGEEKGQFLSLLIAHNSLEVMMISIDNELIKKLDKKTLKLTNFQMMNYTTDMLVALVAEFVLEYVRDDLPPSELAWAGGIPPIVLIYEQPQWLEQESLDRGIIMRSYRGELLSRHYQHEIHNLLVSMLQAWGQTFKVKCIMSFGSACFHDKQWSLRESIASIVLDHGVTLCHLEQTENVHGFNESKSKPKVLMMTDLAEYGSNNELASITTEFDVELDHTISHTPGKKIFRKFVSETYIGELFRLIVKKLIIEHGLLHSRLTYQIRRPFAISSSDVGILENWIGQEARCKRILGDKLGYEHYSLTDLMALSCVADVVTDRATRIIALILAALAERSHEKSVGFVYLGNLVGQHRLIRNRIYDYVRYYTRHLDKSVRVVKASSESALRGAALYASRL